ncbi:MAG: type II secretion system F family protein, partial [Nanoarchaeota archaeon]|nr:type II secretion system F family protein [Nanoarchaeota archaeon]
GFVLVFGVVLVGIINFKIYQRRKGLELILSDYLQLVAANVGAGMPIDQAMWYAVRDRFGILSLEIQTVAKKVMSGTELSDALREFSQKYDSDILNQTITLLIESLETGGEIANLVADVSWNIREGQIMKKEVSADVMSYIIFISFASLFAAPLLFALSLKLITIMSNVMGGIDLTGVAGVSSLFSFQGTEGLVSPRDFKIFTFVCLGSTSLFSSLILSSIKTGSLKNSIKYVPLFVLITYGLFILISAVLDIVFGSLIQIV